MSSQRSYGMSSIDRSMVEINPASGEIVWEYSYRANGGRQTRRFLSITTGGVQRLPNGNTLSLDSNQGRVFEITPQGEIVWEYVNPRGFYRTQRISYGDCPKADPYYMETNGHLGVKPGEIKIPENMGLPVKDGPDYCPRFHDKTNKLAKQSFVSKIIQNGDSIDRLSKIVRVNC